MKKIQIFIVIVQVAFLAACSSVQPKNEILEENKSISVVSLYPEKGKLFKVATIFNSDEVEFDLKGHASTNKELESIVTESLIKKGYIIQKVDTDAIRRKAGRTVRSQNFYGHVFKAEGDLQGELMRLSKANGIEYFLLVSPSAFDPCFRSTAFIDSYGIINRSLGRDLGSKIIVSAYMAIVKPDSLNYLKYQYGNRCVDIPDNWGSIENIDKTKSDDEFAQKMFTAMVEAFGEALEKMGF
jgi:hypothetical protein